MFILAANLPHRLFVVRSIQILLLVGLIHLLLVARVNYNYSTDDSVVAFRGNLVSYL